jgi:phage portal protein BeeE
MDIVNNDIVGDDLAERLLTKKDMAMFFSVTERTITDWMAAGRIPFFKISKFARFRLRDVLERLERENRRP